MGQGHKDLSQIYSNNDHDVEKSVLSYLHKLKSFICVCENFINFTEETMLHENWF